MSKKYLRKNEFRFDLNSKNFNKHGNPHPAYISARYGHKYKANAITHARKSNGYDNYDIFENPNKLSKDKRQTRLSPPYWQNINLFSNKLENYHFSNKTRKHIRKINKKFKQ